MDPPTRRRGDKEIPRLEATPESLEAFKDDVQYLWCSDIPVYEYPPSAMTFLRNHVAVSKPCIIRNSIPSKNRRRFEAATEMNNSDSGETPVPLTMTLDDLVRLFPDADGNTRVGDTNDSSTSSLPSVGEGSSLPPLCVDVTPDGHGDCLRKVRGIERRALPEASNQEEKVFVKPLETEMSLSDFCRRLRKGRARQQQQEEQLCHTHIHDNILDRVFQASSSDLWNPQAEREHKNHSSTDDEDLFFEDCVLYYSRQNDCLRQELTPLWNLKRSSCEDDGNTRDDSFVFPRTFPWAEEAFFGQSPYGAVAATGDSGACDGPDAVNLWMGDERAVSAMHKDHYENLFYVLSGEKVFGLCPPSDAPFLYEREVLGGRFEVGGFNESSARSENNETRRWSVVLDREDGCDPASPDKKYSTVHWIATDLFGSRSDPTDHGEEFPLSEYAHPITVRVQAGELLYLPSLWFHRVTQTRETIGINYWYDMNFESPLWCYFHLLQQLRSPEDRSNQR